MNMYTSLHVCTNVVSCFDIYCCPAETWTRTGLQNSSWGCSSWRWDTCMYIRVCARAYVYISIMCRCCMHRGIRALIVYPKVCSIERNHVSNDVIMYACVYLHRFSVCLLLCTTAFFRCTIHTRTQQMYARTQHTYVHPFNLICTHTHVHVHTHTVLCIFRSSGVRTWATTLCIHAHTHAHANTYTHSCAGYGVILGRRCAVLLGRTLHIAGWISSGCPWRKFVHTYTQ